MDVKSIIEAARRRYRQDGVVLHLPHRDHVESPYPRASSLGLCPLQSAYQKAKTPADYKVFSENTWLMDHGNYVAPMVQLPLMYWAMTQETFAFEPEKPFISHEHQVAGRLDGLLTHIVQMSDTETGEGYLNERCVIEIKDTEGKAMRSVGEPTLRYGLQTLVYMMVFDVSQGAVVTCSKWDYAVWTLRQEDKGYRFYDEADLPYFPSYGANWNTPQFLSLEAVKAELKVLNRYLDYAKSQQVGVVHEGDALPTPKLVLPPIADPLNDPMGWLCLRKENPTSRKKEGWARPNCLWCKHCHGLEDQFYTTVKNGDKIAFKEKT